jgi:hypothetical protein
MEHYVSDRAEMTGVSESFHRCVITSRVKDANHAVFSDIAVCLWQVTGSNPEASINQFNISNGSIVL